MVKALAVLMQYFKETIESHVLSTAMAIKSITFPSNVFLGAIQPIFTDSSDEQSKKFAKRCSRIILDVFNSQLSCLSKIHVSMSSGYGPMYNLYQRMTDEQESMQK